MEIECIVPPNFGELLTEPIWHIKDSKVYRIYHKFRCKDCGKEKLLPREVGERIGFLSSFAFNNNGHCNSQGCSKKPVHLDQVQIRDGWGTLEEVSGGWISLTEKVE